MPGVYLDTSALGRIVLDEPAAPAIADALAAFDVVTSSRLLAIELRRLALRRSLDDGEIVGWLSAVALVPLHEEILASADRLQPAAVATLDAIHLATALRLKAREAIDAVMTYDAQLAAGARHHGLDVVAPD